MFPVFVPPLAGSWGRREGEGRGRSGTPVDFLMRTLQQRATRVMSVASREPLPEVARHTTGVMKSYTIVQREIKRFRKTYLKFISLSFSGNWHDMIVIKDLYHGNKTSE